MRKSLPISIVFAILILNGCQKEPEEIILEAKKCRITKGHYYGGGGIDDSSSFIYDGQGKLIKLEQAEGYYDFVYNGDKIIARIFHHMSGETWYIDSVHYVGDKISEMIFYDYSGMFGIDTIHSKVIFEYANNKLSRLISVEYYDQFPGVSPDTLQALVSWDAAQNIDKMVWADNMGEAYDSILYTYNNHPNYFEMVHPHFFLLDPDFQLHAGFEPHLAYFYSANNVTGFNIYAGFDYSVTYGLDSLNRVTTVDLDGGEYVGYEYGCD